jgi:hypothetical protein
VREERAALDALDSRSAAPGTLGNIIDKPNRIHENGLFRFLRFGGKVRIKAEPK